MKRRKLLFLAAFALIGLGVTGCTTTEKPDDTDNPGITDNEKVEVSEISIELDKATAKVGDILTPTIKIRPTNATNKEYVLSSSDEEVAKIEDGTIHCLAEGSVFITARSKENPNKKGEVKLDVFGVDEEGRVENIFEAEEGNVIPSENGTIRVEDVVDDRVSGTGVVGSLSKGDRIIWGINSSAKDDNALLKMRLMGPSGWLGYWDSIPYNFSDWYTIKINGKILDTESISVEGTEKQGSSADYYAMVDVELGQISLNEGLNTITFVCSNRFDQSTINQGIYNGTISCFGNVDRISVKSSKDLSYVANTTEVENADPDILYKSLKLEVESSTTRIYENKDNPLVDLGDKTSVEFKEKMNIMMGVNADSTIKAKLNLNIATPFESSLEKGNDVALKDILTLNINGKKVDIENITLKAGEIDDRNTFNVVTTGWVEIPEGNNVISVVVNSDLSKYDFKGALDYVEIQSVSGALTPFLNEEPTPSTTYKFEAEANTTKRVGYPELSSGATYVEFIDAKKVQTDIYTNKLETTKIIYGIEASADTFVTISMNMATPYVDENTTIEDVGAGSIGDLWVNGTLISTPNTLKGNNKKGVKDNFTYFTIEEQVELKAGKNRIVWEPQNYTGNEYAYFGALDYIEVTASADLTAYEVNMWTDRNTYFDDANNEPIYVTVDKVSESSPNTCWVGLYKEEDSVEENQPGSLYWYYPTNSAYNSDQVYYLNKPCDITRQNPNSERPLIGAETGGYYKIVYMEKDTTNANNGYDVTDVVHISVWNDPDVYGRIN